MNPSRILFFVSSLRPGGAENHLLNLCRFLRRSSIETAVCTLSPREDGLETAVLEEGISLLRLPLGSLRDLARVDRFRLLRRIVRDARPDLVHAHLYHAEIVSALGTLRTGIPLVVTRHSAGLEFGGRRRFLSRLASARIDAVVAVSAEAADEAVDLGSNPERVVVVPSGVDTSRFVPPDEPERAARRERMVRSLFPGVDPASCLIVGSAGGLKAVKNFPLFVRVAAGIIRRRSAGDDPVRFLILGEGGERRTIERLATALGVTPYLAMPGWFRRPEEAYGLLDLFVLPSLSEGVPMVLLEAMSCGVPCVASDVGGIRDLIGEAGRVVASGDEEGFSAAVRDLLDDHDARRVLSRRARDRMLERFDVGIWGRRMLGVYEDVLGRRAIRGRGADPSGG